MGGLRLDMQNFPAYLQFSKLVRLTLRIFLSFSRNRGFFLRYCYYTILRDKSQEKSFAEVNKKFSYEHGFLKTRTTLARARSGQASCKGLALYTPGGKAQSFTELAVKAQSFTLCILTRAGPCQPRRFVHFDERHRPLHCAM